MVIFDVAPGGRDNYKIWEEQQVPAVIFEMTSKSTKGEDMSEKKTLYERLGVQEYWLFDPKGEWIKTQLRGYRLQAAGYELITDGRSEPLKLRLQVEKALIGFYREDTGEKLLIPEELAEALAQERVAKEQERVAKEQERVAKEREQLARQQAEAQIEQLKAQLRSLGVDPDAI